MTAALEGGELLATRPGRTLPPGKTRYPFYRRLGGPQGRSGRAENLVPTGIRSRTVQPDSSVAIPTELPGPTDSTYCLKRVRHTPSYTTDKDCTCVVPKVIYYEYSEKRCTGVTDRKCIIVEQDSASYVTTGVSVVRSHHNPLNCEMETSAFDVSVY